MDKKSVGHECDSKAVLERYNLMEDARTIFRILLKAPDSERIKLADYLRMVLSGYVQIDIGEESGNVEYDRLYRVYTVYIKDPDDIEGLIDGLEEVKDMLTFP